MYPKFPWVSWSWSLGSKRRSFISPRGERQTLSWSVKGIVGWVVEGVVWLCEDEEMIDGNDEADPCLICPGPRLYQVTCHQDRTDPSLSSRSSSSRPSREPRDIIAPSSYHWCSSPRHFFRHFPPCDHYAFLIFTPPGSWIIHVEHGIKQYTPKRACPWSELSNLRVPQAKKVLASRRNS